MWGDGGAAKYQEAVIKEREDRKLAILEKNNELLTKSNSTLVKSNENLLERIGWLEGQLNLFLSQPEGSA